MSSLVITGVHSEGPTCLAFSTDGIHAFTGGSDSSVRIWVVEEGNEQEPLNVTEAEQPITSIAASDDCWLSSSEDALVRQYIKGKDVYHGDLTEGGGVPVRCISFDPQGKRLAVTSDNPVAKIIDMEDSLKVMLLHGHKHNVRKASWHPTSPILSTCGSDGKIIIWDVSGDDPSLLHTLDGIIPSVSDTSSQEFWHDCSAIWHPSGGRLYVISKTHDVTCISSKDWTQSGNFTDKEVAGTTTALAISPNGAYLATACQSSIYIWSTDKRQLVNKLPISSTALVTQLAFSPTDHVIAWTDASGSFGRWQKPIPSSLPDSVKRPIITSNSKARPLSPGADLFAEDAYQSLDHLESFDDGDDDPKAENGNRTGFDIDDEDFVIDDVGGYMDSREHKNDGPVREMVSITKSQPAFQPGSTPFQGNKQYLAYNMLGVIEATRSEQDEYNLVSVDFFDKSARKSYHFNDTHKCHLAYLGERGALFASDSLVIYKPYGSWTTSQNDWTYTLKKPGAKVLGIAAGGMTPSRSFKSRSDSDLMGFGNVVVATSVGHLIFLSGTGRERRLLALGGDFVTMVAGDEWVMVVYRAGATTIDGSQSLCYKIYHFEDMSVRQRDELPIPKGHTLKWIGITQEGAPVIYDSAGMVHIVNKYRIPHHATWVCVLDTDLLERRAGKDESYWPVGIVGSTFMCLILKGRQEYPGFPRPLVQELPLRMPFSTENEKEEQLERELLLNEMDLDKLDDEELSTDDILSKEKALDKELVVLIQLACKEDNINRAIELTKLLHNINAFDSVAKIADFYHLVGFKEKVGVLKQIRLESEDRFEAAREKRRRWNKVDSRPQRLPDVNETGFASKSKPFQDFGPPPAIYRPGLSRATPAVEGTKYSSAASALTPGSDDNWNDPIAPSANMLSEKRKRDELEELEMESQNDFSASVPPPKQKANNPFARKPAVEKNLFAKKAGNKSTILKSESFFDKVDAVETAPAAKKRSNIAVKNKEKGKSDKEGPRQQTLFGLLGAQNGEKKIPAKQKAALTSSVDETDSQVSDVTMADASQVETQLEETQLVEEEE